MQKSILRNACIIALVLITAAPVWAQRGLDQGQCLTLSSTPKQVLDSTEAAGLAYMREEEKLARDVYATLRAKWGVRFLGNISQSEERHFGAIKRLLDRYELPDPAANPAVGVFKNAGLQTLYADFIKEGASSLQAALRVGATIEDLDIRDLEMAAAATDNNDLKLVYQNLKRASENHLRAFVRQLAARGETYAPQYITPAAFFAIGANSQKAGTGAGMRGIGQRRNGPGNSGVCPWK
jgi:hypothetical protein